MRWANTLNTVCLALEGAARSFIAVVQRGHDQLMDILLIGWPRVPGHWVPAAYLENTWCGVWQIFVAEQGGKYFSTDICDPS